MSKEWIDRFTEPVDGDGAGFGFVGVGAAEGWVDRMFKDMVN